MGRKGSIWNLKCFSSIRTTKNLWKHHYNWWNIKILPGLSLSSQYAIKRRYPALTEQDSLKVDQSDPALLSGDISSEIKFQTNKKNKVKTVVFGSLCQFHFWFILEIIVFCILELFLNLVEITIFLGMIEVKTRGKYYRKTKVMRL